MMKFVGDLTPGGLRAKPAEPKHYGVGDEAGVNRA